MAAVIRICRLRCLASLIGIAALIGLTLTFLAPTESISRVSDAVTQIPTGFRPWTQRRQWQTHTWFDPSHRSVSHTRLSISTRESAPATGVILAVTRDEESWGAEPDGSKRNFTSFLSMLEGVKGLDLAQYALHIMTSSTSEQASYQTLLPESPLASRLHSATVIYHPGYAPPGGDRGARHDNNQQHARRVEIARLRNYLMSSGLAANPMARNVIWIDADIYSLSEGLLSDMVKVLDDDMAREGPDRVAALTAISRFGECADCEYDLNAWRGPRTKPSPEELSRMREGNSSWVASSSGGTVHMKELIDAVRSSGQAHGEDDAGHDDQDHGNVDDDAWFKEQGLVRLDAVGATVLVLNTGMVKQGLLFSTSYLVGTDWDGEGWDAVESEGLCVTANGLGGSCWGMVNGYSRHSVR